MAISRFYSKEENAYDLFYDFLVANKEGTFLEDVTIEQPLSTQIVLSKENVAITMKKASGNTNFFTYSNGKITKNRMAGSSTQSSSNLRSALLCKSGLILGFYINIYATGNAILYNVGIFLDSKSGLSIITQNATTYSDVTHFSLTDYNVISESSIALPIVSLTPQYGSQLTSLAPVVPTTPDNSVTLPNVYAALHTQVSGLGLQAVTIDGENYITNGVWYIKD